MAGSLLISACLMVKNESANLGRCLASIKKFVDEIVVIDTGSTDDTVEIAKHYGARVYHYPWENDFSKHRNQALSHARGSWCFVIDADEELVKSEDKTWGQVRDFFQRMLWKYPASALMIRDIQQGREVLQFNSTRFFRRGCVQYEGIVHNQPKIKDDGQAVYCDFLSIKHYGYDLTPEQKKAKFLRTSSLLLKQVEEGVEPYGFPYFYLCQIYANNGLSKEAVEWGEKYLAYQNCDKFNDSIYFTMLKQYMVLDDQENSLKWLNLGIAAMPDDLDLQIGGLEIGLWINNVQMILLYADRFLQIYDAFIKDPLLRSNRFVYSMRPEARAFVLFHLTRIVFTQGCDLMKKFLQQINSCPMQLKEGFLIDMEAALKDTMLPLKFAHNAAKVSTGATGQEKPSFVMATYKGENKWEK